MSKGRVVRHVQWEFEERLSPRQRIVDTVAAIMGSWRSIIRQSLLLVLWIALIIIAFVARWDP